MKKGISFVFVLFVLALIYQFVILLFVDSHDITYKIIKENIEFVIDEQYKADKDNDIDGYLFNISVKDRDFIYFVDNIYNKQQKIIKDVAIYEKDEYVCIYPISIADKDEFEILCNDGENMHSAYYAHQKKDLSEFMKELKLENDFNDDLENIFEENGMKFFKENGYSNEYIALYRTRELSVYNQGRTKEFDTFISDTNRYEVGTYSNKYFIVPRYNGEKMISSLRIFNMVSEKTKVLNFREPLSANVYTIGVMNNILYLFDLDNKKEYEIDIEDESYKIIGTETDGFTMYRNGKWEEASLTEFTEEKITFDSELLKVKLDYEYDEIFQTNNAYYLIENGKIYKTYKEHTEKRILLLELENCHNIQVSKGKLYFIKDQFLYRYDENGLKTLLECDDLRNTNTNIYYVYNE